MSDKVPLTSVKDKRDKKGKSWLRYIPEADDLKHMRGIGFITKHLTHPMVWSLNRRSVARGTFWGIICAMIPFPVQMISGTIFAYFFRANLPVIMAWILTTNPITAPFVYYVAYLLGAFVLGVDVSFEGNITMDWIWQHYKPIAVGAMLIGVTGGIIGYCLVHFFWRRSIQKRWNERKLGRANPKL